ncbi:diguanylate cyclase [Breoghania sp.]|uniref:diguanylate cyclase domain-containing protein n=1 Tax=Breoghania sp. TaxID=2065378 RepID=UPI00261BE7B9|nr:diguanylate cyclase [Breoghania sp.]MDJ0930094.1 diguanylate cyclase [Breoghania sp.]
MLVVGLFAGLTVTMIVATSYLDLREEDKKSIDNAATVATTVARLATTNLISRNYLTLERELESIAADPMVHRVRVFDAVHHINVDGAFASSFIDDMVPPIATATVLESGLRDVQLTDDMVEITMPITSGDDGPPLGVAFVAFVRPDVFKVVNGIWQSSALIAAFLIAGAMPLTFYFGSGFLHPVRHLTWIAHRVSTGDFDAPFPVERRDEIGVLARAYCEMVRTIRSNMERIYQLAFVDSVTGLCNRECFRNEMERAVAAAEREKAIFAVLFIDLDRFKLVNDTYGHDTGDKLLAAVAMCLSKAVCGEDCDIGDCVRKSSAAHSASSSASARDKARPLTMPEAPIIARLGGDEFAVFVPECRTQAEAARVGDAALMSVRNTGAVDGIPFVLDACIGIALYPRDGRTYTVLLKNADIAMYAAKQIGGTGCSFYNAEVDRAAADRVWLGG